MALRVILSLMFLLLAPYSLASSNCSKLIDSLTSKVSSLSYYQQGTNLKLIYALYAEQLIDQGSFEIHVKNGDVTTISSALEAMAALYNTAAEQIQAIHYLHGKTHKLISGPQDIAELFFHHSQFQFDAFIAELDNHIKNTQSIAPFREKIQVKLQNENIWRTIQSMDSEQSQSFVQQMSSLSGHRTHPLSKMRTAPDRLLEPRFLPESGENFPLDVYAVQADILELSSSMSGSYLEQLGHYYPDLIEQWNKQVAQQKIPAGYLPLMVHPLQSNLLASEIDELISKKQFLKTSLKTALFQPTMSFRTLSTHEHFGSRIKLPLTMQMTSVLRHHAPTRVSMGPKLTSIIEQIAKEDAHFSAHLTVIPEPIGVYLKSGMGKTQEYGLNMMVREAPSTLLKSSDDMALELNSLFELAPNGESLIQQILRDKGIRHGEQLTRYFQDYSEKVLDATLGSFLRYGTSFEGHQQNAYVVFSRSSGDFKGMMIQDLAGGLEIYRPIFEQVQKELGFSMEGLAKALYDEIPIGQEIHTHLNSHLIPLALHLSKVYDIDHKVLLGVLKTNIEKTFLSVQQQVLSKNLDSVSVELYRQFWKSSRESILEKPYRIKALLSMRLMQTEKRIDRFIDNPFVNISGPDLENLFLRDLDSIDNAVDFDQLIQDLARSNMKDQDILRILKDTAFFKTMNSKEITLNLETLFLTNFTQTSFLRKRNHIVRLVQKSLQNPTQSLDFDSRLQTTLRKFLVRPLPEPPKNTDEMVELGRNLFHDPLISGNKNISCNSCHRADMGTSDNLALSVGHGARELAHGRTEGNGAILNRNAPFLYNLGQEDQDIMFWDGRVSFNKKTRQFQTPEPGLNGENPQYKDITQNLSDALAAQALFPMVSREEMRGHGGNELAQAMSNREAWDGIVKRLKGSTETDYIQLFKSAYPRTRIRKINIGHVGSALAAFMRRNFDARNTPLDRYMLGDFNALTLKQKKGLDVFLNKGKCIACHFGADLGGQVFTSIGVPHIQAAGEIVDDIGRQAVSGRTMDRYKYKAPTLRNIALSAPYMHNGSLATLEDVVEHYDDIHQSLMNYQVSKELQSSYDTEIIVDKDPIRNQARFDQTHPIIQGGLNFSEEEEEALVDFLRYGLLDEKFKHLLK
jgi:cytochrome c peroxidase